MSKKIFFLTFLIISNVGLSQITFEPAYYIDNDGNKIDGFIRNVEWKNNPDGFSFKSNLESDSREISIKEAKEFAIHSNIN